METSRSIGFIFSEIRKRLSIEYFIEFIRSIEKDPKGFIGDLIKSNVVMGRPDLIRKIEEEGDFANLNVGDFIGKSCF